MRRILPKEALYVVRRLAKLADKRHLHAYVVGGFVRDLLLSVKNLDIDLVVEGDAIDFAGYAARKLNAALVAHERFGTATLVPRKPLEKISLKIDIATARTENYSHPAALPSVRPGSIKDDLCRRDFTINAMAVSIKKGNFGELVDFFGGNNDLKGKRIKALHNRSFIDDPTRIFRAVRFEQRFGFKIEKRTEGLIKNAVAMEMFDKVSGERLREEIRLLLKEKEPLKAIKRMRNMDELRFIGPGIKFDAASEKICERVARLQRRYKKYFSQEYDIKVWLIYFMVIIDKLTLEASLRICDRFMMRRSDRLSIASCKKYGRRVTRMLSSSGAVKPSRLYEVLAPLSYEALVFLTAKCGSVRAKKRVRDFLLKYSSARLKIKGADLKKLGVKPGPDFTGILRKALHAKIDGKLRTRKDELLFAKRLAKRE